jgi:putative intracellular protease/amidase
MWDLAEEPRSIALIEGFYNAGKPVAAVCHAPGVLHRVEFQGQPIVKGKRVTGFTNGEEEAVHLTKLVPFLVEDELKRLAELYEKAANWVPFVLTDGKLVTGQNSASSRSGAEALRKTAGLSSAGRPTTYSPNTPGGVPRSREVGHDDREGGRCDLSVRASR